MSWPTRPLTCTALMFWRATSMPLWKTSSRILRRRRRCGSWRSWSSGSSSGSRVQTGQRCWTTRLRTGSWSGSRRSATPSAQTVLASWTRSATQTRRSSLHLAAMTVMCMRRSMGRPRRSRSTRLVLSWWAGSTSARFWTLTSCGRACGRSARTRSRHPRSSPPRKRHLALRPGSERGAGTFYALLACRCCLFELFNCGPACGLSRMFAPACIKSE
mmetsp:Transcript_60145/g.135319  ORF Transcript_60145/g.135319 Transcript_60145/m.135319 type:complete len:216 (+) Transcript_60145:136-783(+)